MQHFLVTVSIVTQIYRPLIDIVLRDEDSHAFTQEPSWRSQYSPDAGTPQLVHYTVGSILKAFLSCRANQKNFPFSECIFVVHLPFE
jgi:hypothetical protein